MNTPSFPRMHISLYVKSIGETLDFYTKFFGKVPEKVKPGYAKWILEQPALVISFVEKPDRVEFGFGHLGFQVETVGELKSKLELMNAYKFNTREEMGTSCCFALQDKFWIADPDGYQWEVYVFHEDVQFNDPHHAIVTVDNESCCAPVEKDKVRMEDLGRCAPGEGCS